jgi:hypothetical protein
MVPAHTQPVLKALAYANALVDLSGPLAYEAAYERRRAPGDEGPKLDPSTISRGRLTRKPNPRMADLDL